MFKFKKIFKVLLFIASTFCIYIQRQEVLKLADIAQKNTSKFIHNFYISYLDNKDSKAIDEFIPLYKKTLISLGTYNECNIGSELIRVKRLFENNNLLVAVAHNLIGRYVGYIAIDLKTGYCIAYEIVFTEWGFANNFKILYKMMLENIEIKCKEKSLKKLIIPVSSSNSIFNEQPFRSEKKNQYSSNLIEDEKRSALEELRYRPLQNTSNFKQIFKETFFESYKYDEAWFKNLSI